jgi:hypothetical protein
MITLPLVYDPYITTCYYKDLLQEYVMLWYSFPNKRPYMQCLGFPHKRPLLHLVVQTVHKVWWKIGHKVWCHPHSTEHHTQPIAYLISKQAVPYRTRGGTCCPGVSTPMIWHLADLSTTCHDCINHLHHSNHCSNHNINPHHSQMTSWRMGDHIPQRHKPNSIS